MTPCSLRTSVEQVKTKHRSIDELKKEFAEMNAVFKSDLEILEELLEKYKQPDLSEDHLRTILADLEYYLHQVCITGHTTTYYMHCTDQYISPL